MKSRHKILFLTICIIIFGFFYLLSLSNLTKESANFPSKVNPSAVTPISIITQTSSPSGKCHIQGILPDPNCTPGVIDPAINQDNIQKTICVTGYTKTVRPPVSYTNKLKIQQIKDYGYFDTYTKDYEEDHLISLEIGGSPTDPNNLWPEPGASPNPKDKIENLCHEKICTGQISLSQAQKEIATNWQTACQ
jgi:hypothetical protein